MQTLLKISKLMLMLTFSVSLTGCDAARRTVIVHDGDLLRVGPGVTGRAYVWNAATKRFELSANKIQYPEGWFVTGYHEK